MLFAIVLRRSGDCRINRQFASQQRMDAPWDKTLR
jgi:hypothetical protein